MDNYPFPFPCVFDLGMLRVEVGRHCVVLKRPDREYPHVTQYYQRHPEKGRWWLHATWRRRGGGKQRFGLAEWDEARACDFQSRVEHALVPRVQSVLRPISSNELQEREWWVFVPSVQLLAEVLQHVVRNRNVICFQALEELLEGPEGDELIAELLARHTESAHSVRRPGNYPAFRIGEGEPESGFLYAYELDKGEISWFFMPHDWLEADFQEMVHLVAPGLVEVMQRIAEVLEIDIGGPAMK